MKINEGDSLKQLRSKDIARKPTNKPTSVLEICLLSLSLVLQTTSRLMSDISGRENKRSDSLKTAVLLEKTS